MSDRPASEAASAEEESAADSLPRAMQSLIGTKLGDYRIERALGHGSMGVVFEAVDERLGRTVALKVLPPGLGATEKAILRFLREAKAVAQLSHENIVPIYEIGQVGTTHFYSMQLLVGDSLDKVLRKRGALPAAEASRLLCSAARAVHFAHQRGIIHRDVKPANMILCSDGKLVLTDFGLARPERGASITDSGAMVGTPLYMSPEQVRTLHDVDRRTDVYSLGATLHELLTGRPPFTGSSTQEILQMIVEMEPAALRSIQKNVPMELEVIVLKCLEKNPRKRFPSALELAQDLERFLEGEPILARRSSLASKVIKRLRKHRTISILSSLLGILTLFTILAIGAITVRRNRSLFDNLMQSAALNMDQEVWLTALSDVEQALNLRPNDEQALFLHARALYWSAESWRNRSTSESLQNAMAKYGKTWEDVFRTALQELERVLAASPERSLAYLYRGRVKLALPGTDAHKQALQDFQAAEQKAGVDWETKVHLARARFEVARDARTPRDEQIEFLHHAISGASDARLLLEQELEKARSGDPRFGRDQQRYRMILADVHSQMAEIYLDLWTRTQSNNYYELFKGEAQKAVDLDPSLRARVEMLQGVAAQISDSQAPEQESASQSVTMNLFKLFATTEPTEKQKALMGLLQVGTFFMQEQWQETEEVRTQLLNGFVTTFLPGREIDAASRQSAREFADQARRLLRPKSDEPISVKDRQTARVKLEAATKLNPASANYYYELSVVCESLNDLKSALLHSGEAMRLAPGNSLFLKENARQHLLAARANRESDVEASKSHLKEARTLLEGLLEQYPDIQEFRDLFAELQQLEQELGSEPSPPGP